MRGRTLAPAMAATLAALSAPPLDVGAAPYRSTPPGPSAPYEGDCITAGGDRGRLVRQGASRIEQRWARIGLRTLALPVRAIPPRVPRRPNLCLNRRRQGFPMPSSNSCEPAYGDCVWSGVDGVPWEGDFEWSSDYRNPETPWYHVAFGRSVTIGEVWLWTREGYPLRDFDLRAQDPAGHWHTLTPVRRNRVSRRVFTFRPLRVQTLGVLCLSGPDHQPAIRRITEIQAFAPRPPVPVKPDHFTYRIAVPPGRPFHLEVREAFGEQDTLREVAYEVRVDGRAAFRRRHLCDGPGPVSYAFRVAAVPGRTAHVSFVDTSGQGMSIARVRVLPDPVAQARRRGLIRPLVVAPRIELAPPYSQPGPGEALAAWIRAMEPARPFLQPGLLAIVGFANADSASVAAKIRAYAALAARYRVPWVLQLSSWWADTPLRVPDGLGGTFGDVPYQQIGYSRYDRYDDPGLREFMESVAPGSYSPHYGLTIPNIWSNTPWLTMNNERLNAFKVACLQRAVETANRIHQGPGGHLLRAFVTDDEPVYWARIVDWLAGGYSQVNHGVRRSDLLLDFNPAVVRAAARDGVRLDPTDGLSGTERLWLHENNARYVALICHTIRSGLSVRTASPRGDDLRERIFNYLLAQPLYPLEDYGHPGWEIGVVPGAAVGLESADVRYFERARDLGPLANSDFECGNPGAETVATWEPRFRFWHDVGCQFVQLCNPGSPENWRGLFGRVGAWDASERTRQRALSALVQEAATAEWRCAEWRERFVPPGHLPGERR